MKIWSVMIRLAACSLAFIVVFAQANVQHTAASSSKDYLQARLFVGGSDLEVSVPSSFLPVGEVPQAGLIPAAQDDVTSTAEDVATKTNVTANDATGDWPHSLAIETPPSHGNANPNGKEFITYTPDSNYFGLDSYVYRLCDKDGDCSSATVTIDVTPVNDPPTTVDDSASTQVNASVTIPVLANDTDIENDTLLLQGFDSTSAQGGTIARFDNGTVGDLSDDQVIYTPALNYSGTDTFAYQASDGSASATAQVTVTISGQANDPPLATDDNYTTSKNTPLAVDAAAGVLSNDDDPEGDPLSAVLESGPSNGVLDLQPDGAFTYTPDAEFVGQDSFTYRANDGQQDSNLAAVSIQVQDNNVAPLAAADQYAVTINTTLTVPAPGVLGNDSDPNGDAMTAILDTGTTSGLLSLNTNGSFTYTPNTDFNGQDTFTYHASDGALNSNVATVTITVQVGNVPPLAGDDDYSIPLNNALTVSAPGVLVNDNDPDGDPLQAVLISGPGNGTLTLNGDGSFSYTPTTNFFGLDTFTYRASDGVLDSNLATVAIQVLEDNIAPTAGDDSYSILRNQTLEVAIPGVLGNDSDLNGDGLSAILDNDYVPEHGTLVLNPDGSFTYTPAANFVGVDLFRYWASDGSMESNKAQVTISVVEADAESPSVAWISPVVDEGSITVYGDEIIPLEASASDNMGIASVRFYRWDAHSESYVEIGIVYEAPYRWDLSTSELNWGLNQINAKAYDIYGNDSTTSHIWVNKLRRVFLPVLER